MGYSTQRSIPDKLDSEPQMPLQGNYVYATCLRYVPVLVGKNDRYREVLSEACAATTTDTWSWTATKKMAQRKLDSVSFVNAYCCYANSELEL